ncbi:MAG: hypothetical protein GEU74_01895 [Nitriliruptorales bacterium]|nr:hypothetical protein [Nitriliruptorales bacterium]
MIHAAHRAAAAAVMLCALLAACGTGEAGSGVAAIQPRDGRSGLQLSGTLDGRQFAVNDGAPVLRLGDCDVNDGADVDLCFFTRELEGGFFGIVVENPDVVRPGVVEVTQSRCASPHCDDVTDGAVVEVQFAPGAPRVRATGGRLRLTTVEKGRRYAGTLHLTLPDGAFSGTFEVVPRPVQP